MAKQIQLLLDQVNQLQNKYDQLTQETVEDYNIFNLLKVQTNELQHSTILADLLNPNGLHKQRDLFLKLFINQIQPFYTHHATLKEELQHFNTRDSFVKSEVVIGFINQDYTQGGRIDIRIKNNKNQIIIENKLEAKDQYKQLVRYKNYAQTSPIIYLTLFGDEPSEDSKGDLINGIDFICISYEKEIVEWLEACKKGVEDKPSIHEMLKQYLRLIKQITNQTINDQMGQELTQLIIENPVNYQTYKQLLANQNQITNLLVQRTQQILTVDILPILAQNHNLSYEVDSNLGAIYSYIYFRLPELDNFYITLQFQSKALGNPTLACSTNDKTKVTPELVERFKTKFDQVKVNNQESFVFYIDNQSSDMAAFYDLDLKELQFNKKHIVNIIHCLDSFIKQVLEVLQSINA